MIGIHHESGSFSGKWIEYCKNNSIPYKIVNCYATDIIDQMRDCHGLMWHWAHYDHKAQLFARQLAISLEIMGKRVFPDSKTCWHYDDKVGQKYLLEAVNAPIVPSYVFYDKKNALKWAKSTSYPKVFKLRSGAGSSNVMLVDSKYKAIRLINKSFKNGFVQFNPVNSFKDKFQKYLDNKISFKKMVFSLGRIFFKTDFMKYSRKEIGYVYFQDFLKNNQFDIRIIVVGNKAFAIKRMNRKNDFRASGSNNISYDKLEINIECLKIAFKVNNFITAQSVAYDFIFDDHNDPQIVEISYCWTADAYDNCPGYWDDSLKWHEGKFNPYGWMIENLKQTIN